MKNTLETRLGLFFALAALAAFAIFEMVGGTDFFKRVYHVSGYFNNVSDLKVGDPVKMGGKQIGRVDGIDFDQDRLKVTMRVEKQYAIKTDSKATIKFAGLMGQNFVAVNIGKAPTHFEDNGVIETVEQPDLSALMAKLENVATGVENVTKTFSGDSIQNMLGPMTDFMKNNNKNMTLMIANMKNVSDSIAQGKGTVGKLINDDSLYTNALATVQTLNSTADEIKNTVHDAKSIITNVNNTVLEAQSTLTEAKKVVAEINEGKGTVGRLVKDEKLYNETTTAMTNLKEILQKVNQGQGSVGKLVNDESFLKNVKLTLQKLDTAAEGLEDTGPLSVLGTAANKLF